jgi:hypothetical protein
MKKIVLMMAAAVCLIGCGKKETQTQQEAERVEVVSTMTLKTQEIERVLNISSNLQGYLTQNVAPSLTGKIEHIYTVQYVLEGYELKKEIASPLKVYFLWENVAGEKIAFKQYNLLSTDFFLDGENGSTLIIEHNQIKVYFRQIDDSYYYIWSDGTYAFCLSADVVLDENEIIRIIDNLVIK